MNEKLALQRLKSIAHPNSLKVQHVSQNSQDVIERCHQGDILDLVSKTTDGFTETTTRVIMNQLLTSFKIIFDQGLSHNDLKLENAVIDQNQHCKFIDFGFTSEINYESTDYSTGTLPQLSPEKLYGLFNPYFNQTFSTQKNDIQSLGSLMQSLIKKQFLFSPNKEGNTLKMSMQGQRLQEQVSLKTLGANSVSKFKQMDGVGLKLLLNLLEFNPEERFNLEFLNKNGSRQDDEIMQQLEITNQDWEIQQHEIDNLILQ